VQKRRYGSGVFLVALGVAAALLCLGSPASAQHSVGSITELTGTAHVQRAAATLGAKRPMELGLQDQVTTDPDSTLSIALPDKTILSVVQQTTLAFDRMGQRPPQLKLLLGDLRVSAIPPNPLEIRTPNGSIRIAGTDFETTYTEGVVRPGYGGCERYTDVAVREGVVAISNPSIPTVVVEVPAGYETTIPCLLPPLNPGPIGIAGSGTVGRTSSAAAVTGSAAPPPDVGISFPVTRIDP
jgi:ferric-dicitrate binding protein FerR (iron transport regulator)